MKFITTLLFLSLANFSAADPLAFEASIGRSSGMTNGAYSLGVTGLVTDTLRWRAGYASLGTPAYNTLATPPTLPMTSHMARAPDPITGPHRR